ncbi:MAG: ribonuclease D [Alphaproteobacteria bacterium]|nr:ribonuclease D [Alphaproteobacteria bacterium]
MTLINNTDILATLCRTLREHPFVTIDTEFLRDKTYYPQLCLVQLAGPGVDAMAVDPLAGGLNLDPLYELLFDDNVIKVFHAARQDLEIVYNLTGKIPQALFDTQVAAMVCGFGDQIGYNNLVGDLVGVKIDKGAQFTDWSRRPLSDRQLYYALDDVIHLRDVYLKLSAQLDAQSRRDWVLEEMAVLRDTATYSNIPEESWARIKLRTDKPQALAVLREIAAWREREAQRRDVPRNRIVRDETLADIAMHPPRNADDLAGIRGFSADMARGKMGQGVLEAVAKGLATPRGDAPKPESKARFPSDMTPVLEMLKMLLRIQCSENDVAGKLVASATDLEALAMDDNADIPALKGWRFEVFGREALRLKHGEVALSLKNGKICKTVTEGAK